MRRSFGRAWCVVAMAALACACGGKGGDSDASGDAGEGGDGGTGVHPPAPDGDTIETDATYPPTMTDGSPGPGAYDGTVGKPCASDADCKGAGGPGVNLCSSDAFGVYGPALPTPVCVVPSCNPGTDKLPHYCDGPDDPSSPGLCVPAGGGQGICLPKCTYHADGKPPSGCVGNDACNTYTVGTDATGQTIGIGYCYAGCTSDAQCPSGSHCQLDEGSCFHGLTTRTKKVGDACTSADTQSGACYCLAGTSGNGYCTSFCEVGGTTCPSGFTCEGYEVTSVGFTTPNNGLGGVCAATCSGTTTCPGMTVCSSLYLAGPDCQPQ